MPAAVPDEPARPADQTPAPADDDTSSALRFSEDPDALAPSPEDLATAFAAGRRLQENFLPYQFAVREILTKLEILRDEIAVREAYNPIEHITHRIKSLDSIAGKLQRRGLPVTIASMRDHLDDIAGVRVICSFIADTYRLQQLLQSQPDVEVLELKDYIATPKPNGYRGLHAIVETPVHLSTGSRPVRVEIQFRTIAMDFWASLEHKTFYKYDQDVPAHLVSELTDTAEIANLLDRRMEVIHKEIRG